MRSALTLGDAHGVTGKAGAQVRSCGQEENRAIAAKK